VLALVDEYIRWYNHERIKQSLSWMSPVQYRQSQGMEYSCRMNQIEANRVL
ncbi:IS3 family transposase, partial [Bifidobacterium longum]